MDKDDLFKIQNNTLNVKVGDVLLSEPFMNDLHFTRAAILIVDHNDVDGTLGVVINKYLHVPSFNEIIKDFPTFDGHLFLGGPVATDSIFYIHSLGPMIPESTEILKGIYWGGNINAVKALIREGLITKNDIRFYIGYAGWEAGQLREELIRNTWTVASVPPKMLLNTRPNDMWGSFTKLLGKRYQLWHTFPVYPSDN